LNRQNEFNAFSKTIYGILDLFFFFIPHEQIISNDPASGWSNNLCYCILETRGYCQVRNYGSLLSRTTPWCPISKWTSLPLWRFHVHLGNDKVFPDFSS